MPKKKPPKKHPRPRVSAPTLAFTANDDALHRPHDALVKEIFSDPALLAAWLRLALPRPLSRSIDWASLEVIPGEVGSSRLKKRYLDLAARARWADGSGVALFNIEHKSTARPRVPWECIERSLLLTRAALVRQKPDDPLPSTLAVLLAHAGRPWRQPLTLTEMARLPPAHPARGYIPEHPLILDDLSALSSDDLADRDLPDLALLCLVFLKYARDAPDILVELERFTEEIRRVTNDPQHLEQTAALMRLFEGSVLRPRRADRDLSPREGQPQSREGLRHVGGRPARAGAAQGASRRARRRAQGGAS